MDGWMNAIGPGDKSLRHGRDGVREEGVGKKQIKEKETISG